MNEHSETLVRDADGGEGDWAVVARCASPTQAHLLKGTLQAAGLHAIVADANVVQANPLWTNAVGGVRVLVPASQIESARQTIASFDAGEFDLDGAAPQPQGFALLQAPVFSPDGAALWSLVLTPAFGTVLHVLNARSLQEARLQRIAWAWLAVMLPATAAGLYLAARIQPGVLAPLRASLVLSFPTVVWYFLGAHQQSRYLLERHGPRYPRRPLWLPALAAAFASMALAALVAEFV